MGKGLRRIGRCAFFRNKLVELDVYGNVEEIGEWAFADNPLKSLTLQEGTKKIGNVAFRDTKLLSIVLPTTVTDIGEQIAPEYTKIKQARSYDNKENSSKQLPTLEELKKEKLRLIAELEKIDAKIKGMELDNISIEK